MQPSAAEGRRAMGTILALAAAHAAAFLGACAALNGRSAFTRYPKPEDVKLSLFAVGGVLGEQRGVWAVAAETTFAGLLGLVALGSCDLIFARHTKARYFALHVIANIWITILCLPDLWFTLSNPIKALSESRTNHWPTALVFSIHVYHVAFFRNLQWIDWLHHILMIVIGAPILITAEVGPLMNFNNFFMCGVPGGIDYAMLFAVKHGWLSPITEKEHNAFINVWVRAPFLVCTATFAYIQFFVQEGVPFWLCFARGFLVFLACWNGLYFMERVVGNVHVQQYKEKAAKGKSASQHMSDYETSEHFAGPSLLGLGGMRVSVSMQDLRNLDEAYALKRSENSPPAARGDIRKEAYPAMLAKKAC